MNISDIKIAKDTYWVGKIDNREVPFHRLILAKGTTYNSYLLKTGKPTVIDTVDMEFGREYADRMAELIDPLDIAYIVINHTEPDHPAGRLRWLCGRLTLLSYAQRSRCRKFRKCTSCTAVIIWWYGTGIRWISAAKRCCSRRPLTCIPLKR